MKHFLPMSFVVRTSEGVDYRRNRQHILRRYGDIKLERLSPVKNEIVAPSVSVLSPDNTKVFTHSGKQFDTDKNGKISLVELSEVLKHGNYNEDEIPPTVVRRIHEMADQNQDGFLDFPEFVDMMRNPEIKKYFRRYLDRYMEILIPRRDRRHRGKTYASEYKWCPPPVGMIIISVIEIIFYAVDAIQGYETVYATGPMAVLFIFNPYKRKECWRYLTYMFVHCGGLHLTTNLIVQITLAIPLEMVHRWWRILIIYLAGVLSGSLSHSIINPSVKLAGASGGTYSVITAHLATIIMNWGEMRYKTIQLLIFVIFVGADLGNALYENFYLGLRTNVGYIAHIGGALAGLLVGINVMRNLKQTKAEVVIWWISMIVFCTLTGIAVLLNIFWKEHFPLQMV